MFCLETAMLLWLPCLCKQPAVSGTKILAIPGKKKEKNNAKIFSLSLKKKIQVHLLCLYFPKDRVWNANGLNESCL